MVSGSQRSGSPSAQYSSVLMPPPTTSVAATRPRPAAATPGEAAGGLLRAEVTAQPGGEDQDADRRDGAHDLVRPDVRPMVGDGGDDQGVVLDPVAHGGGEVGADEEAGQGDEAAEGAAECPAAPDAAGSFGESGGHGGHGAAGATRAGPAGGPAGPGALSRRAGPA
ncbi:hypothetical protein [Dactylosporangium fulvum]|uniref:hypothetical protein n=1 Tax=Dactylosporangium fulvum TaxID=53359 RepID=UPI0031D3303E